MRSVWFSDEAHFYLSGTVNSRNNVHWASERPDEVIERNLHVTKATAWVALSAQGVIEPFWFCNEDGATETVTADRYICMCLLASGEHCDGYAAMKQKVSSVSRRTEPLLIRQDGSSHGLLTTLKDASLADSPRKHGHHTVPI